MAGDEKETVESSPTDILTGLNPEQYQEYQLTGNLPEPPKEGDSAPSDTPKAAKSGPAEKPAETKPAADPGKQPEETPEAQAGEEAGKTRAPGAERRIHQLLGEVKDLKSQLEQERASKPPKVEKQPEATAGGPEVHPQGIAKPTVDDRNADGSDKYPTYESYLEAASAWKADVRVAAAFKAEREQRDKEAKEAEIQKRETELKANWEGRVADYEKEKPDFKEVALTPEVVTQFSKLPLIQGWIVGSPAGPALLYHLVSKPEELARIEALDAFDKSRELTKLEISLTPASQATPPAKKVTAAPKPPTELAAKGTAPTDEVEAAVKDGDFARFKAEQDRLDMAASSSRR